jgi:exodeoxyribonuclease V alpha subunit
MDTLSGSIERVTFYNAENGYSVLRLKPDFRPSSAALSRDGMVTLTGNLPELAPGEHVRLQGNWLNNPKYGLQFQVEICEQTMPATTAGIQRYLGSGLIKGIGPRLAERIVASFGDQTLEVIEREPERLLEVPDIGPLRSKLIALAWEEQKQVKEVMVFLHSHNVSTNLAIKIYKQYGDQSLDVVQTDPYRLARDIFGVGFKTADRLAQALGLPADHPSRIEAGVVYALGEMSNDGHVYSPRLELTSRAAELLEVPVGQIEPAVERLALDDRVRLELVPLPNQIGSSANGSGIGKAAAHGVSEAGAVYSQPAVYLTPFYVSETSVAQRLRLLSQASEALGISPRLLRAITAKVGDGSAELSSEQAAAVHMALTSRVSVLTGGPGTGKTTALKALIDILEAAHKTYALASPTGRAAKRLSEATGRPASTIHRLLGFSPGEGFKYNADNPLPVEFLVVDEASMLDLMLTHHLLKSLRPGTHLLLVGDVDQLPSVGAGDVLRDVIASGLAPVTSLKVIFRQAAGSRIITNAHRINQGLMPDFSPSQPDEPSALAGDFFLFPAENAEQAADWVLEVVCERIPHRFNLLPQEQVQVLAPMYRGPAGVHALNERLQAALNPPDSRKAEKTLFGQLFRPGDKVMQIQNNYEKDVYNGDIGRLADVDMVEHSMDVNYDGRLVAYDWSEADQLVLAYAISGHKSQGSEFPAVVIPVVTQHYLLLQRNLLYTAITRARKLCVLVGSRKAIGIAVKNNKVAERYTALEWRLKSGASSS